MLNFTDIAKIFEEIELRLVSSLKRNLQAHKDWEDSEGFNWSAWQAEKLRNMENFRKSNASIMSEYTNVIDDETHRLMAEQFQEGENLVDEQLAELKDRLPESDKTSLVKSDNFFGVNEQKMQTLMNDITTLEKTTETAALRMTDDVYRQTVNRVQLAMAAGSMTLNQAVDIATKDFLSQGINCIVYSDGKRVNIADYVRMALRTTSTRGNLQGRAKRFAELGYDTVLVSQYGGCSKTCEPWQGKVYIDDVFTPWQGEIIGEYGISNYCGKRFMLLSVAIRSGLFHPNCRHTLLQYIDGITEIPKPIPADKIKKQRELEQKQRYMERKIRKLKRQAEGTCDPQRAKEYRKKLREAQHELKVFVDEHYDVLRRDYSREKVYGGGIGSADEREKSSRKNNPTSVNFEIVNSPEYREKFNGISDNPETDNLICEKARDMLMHRNNSYYEDMYLIDCDSKSVVGVQTHSTVPQRVTYNKSLISAIKTHKPHSLISMHNHPESKPPSGSDFSSCGSRKYQKGIICCHNGDVYIYQIGRKPFTALLFDNTVDKYKKIGYNENKAYRKALDQFVDDYGIKWEVR